MLALLVAEAILARSLLMIQAGIHRRKATARTRAYRVAGAAYAMRLHPELWRKWRCFSCPRQNVDGHEAGRPLESPNQNGPEQTGWRTTAQNLNLNRDYAKADAPEMQALLRLIRLDRWRARPARHGRADFEPDVSIRWSDHQGDPNLYQIGRICAIPNRALPPRLSPCVLPGTGGIDVPLPVCALRVTAALLDGLYACPKPPDVLVETHSWKDYATRVRVTRNTSWV